MKSLLILLISSIYLFASSAFIQAHELQAELKNKNLVILDTTDQTTYKAGHIPGALNIDVSKLRHKVHGYQLMNSEIQIQKLFRSFGINNNSKVVIYGHNKGKELLKASYLALTLITNGLINVSILNGGYPEWVAEYEFDNLISTKQEKPKVGNFTVKHDDTILVDIYYMKEHIGKTPMIEARPLKYFNGSSHSKGVKRLGHINQAKSSYWREKFDSEYKLKKDTDLKNIYIKNNKLNPNKEVITYCTGGLEASMNWYILYAHLKFKNVKLYDASMRQWGNLDSTPMTK